MKLFVDLSLNELTGVFAEVGDTVLFCNLPLGAKFHSTLSTHASTLSDTHLSIYEAADLNAPGLYEFWLDENARRKIIVNPSLRLGNTALPARALSILTLVTERLGSIEHWDAQFVQAAKSRFNCLHFTPVQPLGSSHSAYSLTDHLQVNPKLIPGENYQQRLAALEQEIERVRVQHRLLSFTDLVLNHTSVDSEWLLHHPEAAYNTRDCAHLRSAFELDMLLQQYSRELAVSATQIKDKRDINVLLDEFFKRVQKAALWEYFVLDVDEALDEFNALAAPAEQRHHHHHLPVYRDDARWHHCYRVDAQQARRQYADAAQLKEAVEKWNIVRYAQVSQDLESARNSLFHTIKYERLDSHGPKLGKITHANPLAPRYFVPLLLPAAQQESPTSSTPTSAPFPPQMIGLAHNGWIWGGDAMQDFALEPSRVYFQRSLIAWTDSVKLRYGKARSDNEWLWDYMTQYVRDTARVFHGVRLDNAHSTPIHLASHLMREARSVRPELFVFAELFTNSVETDRFFTYEIGINALVRETVYVTMPQHLEHILHKHAHLQPCAALRYANDMLAPRASMDPPSLYYDQTHDNEAITTKFSAQHAFALAAVLSFCPFPVGSTKGFDELVPHVIHVVDERRNYERSDADARPGFSACRALFHEWRERLCGEQFLESNVETLDSTSIMLLTREDSRSGTKYILLVNAVFGGDVEKTTKAQLKLAGRLAQVEFFACVENVQPIDEFKTDKKVINSLGAETRILHGDEASKRAISTTTQRDGELSIDFELMPGSAMLLRIEPAPRELQALSAVEQFAQEHERASSLFNALSLGDFNALLFRCDEEEKSSINDAGTYDVPGHGRLVYCGLMGLHRAISLPGVPVGVELHTALAQHLMQSTAWWCGYTLTRLRKCGTPALRELAAAIAPIFEHLAAIRKRNAPMHLFTTLHILVNAARRRLAALLTHAEIRDQQLAEFARELAFSCVALTANVPSSPLAVEQGMCYAELRQPILSMGAGLPHFATGFMRNWGRDTFIALRGALLLSGRFQDARNTLIAYASTLRHGLIPNLLDGGRNPRYNARDATWWFLQALQEYCAFSKSVEILSQRVPRVFAAPASMGDIVHEIMQKHAAGIRFREFNAGPSIDSRMQDQGFNVSIELNLKTGLLHGGNPFNCGTWMDKMGESTRARNYGVPATPRDGAPIEIAGLLKSTLRWLSELAEQGAFQRGVALSDGAVLSYAEWNGTLQSNFEQQFYIDQARPLDGVVHRRGIYRDCVGASQVYADFQLRPNQCVAMAVAPELFVREHALSALEQIERLLCGPLGMRTLDPDDWNYKPNYDNSPDTDDYATSKGFNYHQGPEWVWLFGYFLRALVHFTGDRKRAISLLRAHRQQLRESAWCGLPELTNKDGSPCPDSCPTQLWSLACINDAVHCIAE
jgi:glycogen debranching enzyme